MSDTEARTIGRYRLLEEVGQGGMSVVYRAKEMDSGEIVAIKVLSPYIAQEPRFKARFDREVGLLSQMNHPNIVPILNYGEEQGNTYIVMPYYSGGTLQDLIDRDYMDLREVGKVLEDIAAGLDHAHLHGIVHRDIKPSNIVIDSDGRALISDFGFAHVEDSSHSLTGSVLIGTPAFMSPEQCAGHEVDPRSDQYSLGAVLYLATTGKLPYQADTPMGVVLKHVSEPLTRPRYINPLLPDAVESVIERAMAKDPGLRYLSVAGLSEAFSAALEASLNPSTGLPKPDAVGPTPETQVLDTDPTPIWGSRRTLVGVALLVMIAVPLAALGFSGALNAGDAEAGGDTPTPSALLLATIDALSTANAEQMQGAQAPGAVETAVAATVEAMGLFDTPTTTPMFSDSPAPSSTPTWTPTPGSFPTATSVGNPPPGPPPPGASATPTPTTSGPTNTPAGPTSTPAATDTPSPPTATSPPPTTDPSTCKGPDHPVFPCTDTPEP